MPPQQTQGKNPQNKMDANQAAAALGFATSISRSMFKQGYTDFADMGGGMGGGQAPQAQQSQKPQQSPQQSSQNLQQEIHNEVKKTVQEEMAGLKDEIKKILNESN